jgi:SAM-dependent methyltransferase
VLARHLEHVLVLSGSGRCLEVAALNPFVFGGWLRARGWSYESVDTRRLREASDPGGFDTFIDHDADVTDLRFAGGGTYELLILQHVLEEVGDYRAALDELARVLEPGGRAILEIPFADDTPATRHKDPDRYGNRWRFGTDLLTDLEARFAAVELHRLAEDPYTGTFFVCTGR